MTRLRFQWTSGAAMALIYTAIAVVMTWPLARTAGTRLAWDIRDPAFVCWVLAWDTGQMLAALHGHPAALAQYWNANIFYPEPLTLAYSEHFTGQALQVLPVYAATGNILLAYNLLFLSTFALSGLAVYLLVRDLGARPFAAFVGGLAYAYAPYRMGQFAHLQVLSSFWMPLALLGFHRYFRRVTERIPHGGPLWPLAGASAALVMQHLSCGYYMLFFAPFVAAYCLFEMTQRRLLRRGQVWLQLTVAAVVIGLATWPFVSPYLQLRALNGLGVRSMDEIVAFSADVHAFATVSPSTRLFGERLRGFVKPEGDGFPGFTILTLASGGLVWGLRRSFAGLKQRAMQDWQAALIGAATVWFVIAAVMVGWFFVSGEIAFTIGHVTTVYRNVIPFLLIGGMALAVFITLGAMVRRQTFAASESAVGFFSVALLCAALFALGPRIQALGHTLGPGPYRLLLAYVPGFESLRVPARLLMLVALFLSVLAGLGAEALLRIRRQWLAVGCLGLACAGIIAEAWVAPAPLNLPMFPDAGLSPPRRLQTGRRTSPIYRTVRDLPGKVALVEFPFGDPAYEVAAVFYAGYHRRPILNGYSGFFPASYTVRLPMLSAFTEHPEEGAAVLREAGVTHALVHERAYQTDQGRVISQWFSSHGARLIASDAGDLLFALPSAPPSGAPLSP